ncbi:MAG TPA: hypothetical protein VNG33_15665 [Polyangiaceae bacterium]|nr:hypothetical protein [Polyangiaceae bacterium]
MPSDLYFPTACDSCDRTWLAPPGLEPGATCRFCSEPAQVVPGETYRAEDIGLFERIESAVYAAQLAQLPSQRLWATLSEVAERGRRPDLLLRPVINAMPALQFVQEAFVEDRTQLAHAVGMILVVITAHLRALEAHQRLWMTAAAAPPR